MSHKLEIINVTKKFDKRIAVDNVSFDVEAGEFLAVLGPSGCGKTTLLRMIIGLLPPTEGLICKDGKDITRKSPSERGMGIVFQNFALFENMTVLGNIEYAMKVKKVPDYRQRSQVLIDELGLNDLIEKRPAQLSGGQQQKVAIARTLALNPDIMLFDEPMSSLDAAMRLSLRKVIKEIQKRHKTTMIYITHDQEEAFALADRILVMDRATLIQIDTPERIIKYPANDYVKSFVTDNLTAKINSLVRFVR